jgi:hypothetical protein
MKYKDAVEWIANNDGAGDAQVNIHTVHDAYETVKWQISTCMLVDISGKDQHDVAVDILLARGFSKTQISFL